MLLRIQREHSRGAQRVLNYLGVIGIAGWASSDGELLCSSPSSAEDEPERLNRIARRVAEAMAARTPTPLERIAVLESQGPCIYYAPVRSSWLLFVVIDEGIAPAAVTERMSRALAVFDRVLSGAGMSPSGGPGGAPESAVVALPLPVPKLHG